MDEIKTHGYNYSGTRVNSYSNDKEIVFHSNARTKPMVLDQQRERLANLLLLLQRPFSFNISSLAFDSLVVN